MNVKWHPMGVLLFSIKSIFYNEMDLKLFFSFDDTSFQFYQLFI